MTADRRTLAALVFAFGIGIGGARDRGPRTDQPAPDFQATTAAGEKRTLADFKGQVLVINYWATWCTPCKQELPLLDAYYRAQRDHGMRVLAITTEDSLPLSRLKKVGDALAIPLVRSFSGDYGVMKAVPTNHVIDRRGVLRYAKAAAFSLDDLNEILVPLLRESADDAAPMQTM
jgi:peroxiredoxin